MITSVIETSADEVAVQIDRCRWVVVGHDGQARTESLVWGTDMVSGPDYEKEMNDLTEGHDERVAELHDEHAQELELAADQGRAEGVKETLESVLDALFEFPEATAALEAAMKGKP